VFDTAVHNPYRFPPRWLNEGLAVYLSQGFAADDRQRVRQAAGDHTLMPLVALGGQFPTDPDQTLLAYAESVSAIDYLVRKDGQATLVDLVKAYAAGLTDDEAFTKATGSDLQTFQAGWLADLGATEPTRYGPQPAPAGPLPPGWTGPAPSAGAPQNAVASPVVSAAASSGPAAPAPTAVASAPLHSDPDGGSVWLPVLIVLGVALLLVVAGLVLARRRERAPGP
jgi:peptidase MA superfamily protein